MKNKHPHRIAELEGILESAALSDMQLEHVHDMKHDVRELIDQAIILHDAYPWQSIFSEHLYATIRVQDSIGQTVYLIGGNAGKQALSMVRRSLLPKQVTLRTLETNGHELYYWEMNDQ